MSHSHEEFERLSAEYLNHRFLASQLHANIRNLYDELFAAEEKHSKNECKRIQSLIDRDIDLRDFHIAKANALKNELVIIFVEKFGE